MTGAVLSPDKKYRYSLFRIWDKALPVYVWIMLNPSTAGVNENDPTIRKCMGFVKHWGGGGLYVVNLFAFRATLPQDLWEADYPIGKTNDRFIEMVKGKGRVVLAWGASIKGDLEDYLKNRPRDVLWNLAQPSPGVESPVVPFCLGLNKDRSPKHPVRLAYSTPLVPFSPPPEICPGCKRETFQYDPGYGQRVCSYCDMGEDNLGRIQ